MFIKKYATTQSAFFCLHSFYHFGPNPTDNNVTIKHGSEFTEITALNLFDVQGKLIQHIENISQEIMNLFMSSFKKGIYILNVVSTKDAKNYKIVKQ